MKIHVLTISPGIFDGFLSNGVVKRAIEKSKLEIDVVNIRDFAEDRYSSVDDTPYGGGAGMIMRADILAKCLKSVMEKCDSSDTAVIYLTPQGKTLDQEKANSLSMINEFVLICGRYRGIDERFVEKYITDELSIGDYVLSGGEPAAMVVIDSVARLIPGVLNDFESGIEDSFQDNLLDCPWFTRPAEFEGMLVPDVLMKGDHRKIKEWRLSQAYKRTVEKRPDILNKK